MPTAGETRSARRLREPRPGSSPQERVTASSLVSCRGGVWGTGYYGYVEVRVMVAVPKSVRQFPLKVDPETDQLISQGARFLGLTKKDLVAEAVRVYLEQRCEDLRSGMAEALQVLDRSLKSDVMLLTGLTAEEIDAVGGIGE